MTDPNVYQRPVTPPQWREGRSMGPMGPRGHGYPGSLPREAFRMPPTAADTRVPDWRGQATPDEPTSPQLAMPAAPSVLYYQDPQITQLLRELRTIRTLVFLLGFFLLIAAIIMFIIGMKINSDLVTLTGMITNQQ